MNTNTSEDMEFGAEGGGGRFKIIPSRFDINILCHFIYFGSMFSSSGKKKHVNAVQWLKFRKSSQDKSSRIKSNQAGSSWNYFALRKRKVSCKKILILQLWETRQKEERGARRESHYLKSKIYVNFFLKLMINTQNSTLWRQRNLL